MKKITHKLVYLFLTAIFFAVVSSVTTAFAADKTMSITLRIEGIKENLYYDKVEIPYTEDSLTLQEALAYIDEQNDTIAITGVDTSYITEINGEAAGQFGGWDGWLYKVNNAEASVSIDALELADGDSALLYYGDPYGVGMQFPAADASDIEDGIIRFTSSDTTYDESNNAIMAVNPVAGATVTWESKDAATEYVTDENGEIKIASDELAAGSHKVQISKTGDSGIPLVLRLEPDFKITVMGKEALIEDNTSKEAAAANTAASVPRTGEQIAFIIVFLVLAIAALFGFIALRGKSRNEK